MFDLNVFSIVHLTRIVIPHFVSNGGGTIAVMSSAAGKAGAPFSGTYTATKHALHVRKNICYFNGRGIGALHSQLLNQDARKFSLTDYGIMVKDNALRNYD